MGVASSTTIADLDSNAVLLKLVGEEKLLHEASLDDSTDKSYWDELLSFAFQPPDTRGECKILEEATNHVTSKMALNNPKTGNFATLVELFMKQMKIVETDEGKQEDNEFTWRALNSAFLVRSFVKYFVENLTEKELVVEFNGIATEEEEAKADLFADFIDCLLTTLSEIPVTSFTYGILLEVVNILLILLSRQLWEPISGSVGPMWQCLLTQSNRRASIVIRTLLINFIHQEQVPPANFRKVSSGILSSIGSAASGLLSMIVGSSKQLPEGRQFPLAEQSLLLFLVLTNQHTAHVNPYRLALKHFADLRGQVQEQEAEVSFVIQLDQLYFGICSSLGKDQAILLLYMLLHENPGMSAFIFSRSDIENLVLPVLELLYTAEKRNSHLVYMALIVLLIFSQDDSFNKSIHETVLKPVAWYTERSLSHLTLGDLLVLVLIRTIQYNIAKVRDKYLHTNCLAALANMSSSFIQLHQYVAQRLVSLFGLLAKKHAKMNDIMRRVAKGDSSDVPQDYVNDLPIVDEVMRMVLEIINSCLTHSLHLNPNLVYALLYKQELFAVFRTHPTFHDIIQNIETVISYFTAKLEAVGGGGGGSVDIVQKVIEKASLSWPRDRIRKFPELKFRYVEEDQPEEFFVPYVWSLVFHCSGLYWDSRRIALFSVRREE